MHRGIGLFQPFSFMWFWTAVGLWAGPGKKNGEAQSEVVEQSLSWVWEVFIANANELQRHEERPTQGALQQDFWRQGTGEQRLPGRPEDSHIWYFILWADPVRR